MPIVQKKSSDFVLKGPHFLGSKATTFYAELALSIDLFNLLQCGCFRFLS